MKYIISINQKIVIELGLDLDIIDLAIFDFIKSFANTDKCRKITDNGVQYFWISSSYVIEEMPLLGIKSDRGISKRIDNLINSNLIERCPNNQSMQKSYYKFGSMYYELEFATTNESSKHLERKFQATTNESSKDNNISNNNININRESVEAKASTLELRKEKFGESLIPFVEKYGKAMIRAFFDYWTEPNRSQTKMRFELQKTWETSRRLATWASRETFSKSKTDIGIVLTDNSIEKFENESKRWDR